MVVAKVPGMASALSAWDVDALCALIWAQKNAKPAGIPFPCRRRKENENKNY